MTSFQPGDIVQWNKTPTQGGWGTTGDEMRVTEVNAEFGTMKLAGNGRVPYLCENFDLVRPAPSAPAPDKSLATVLDEAVQAQADNPVRPNHYLRYKITPLRFIMENNLPFPVGNIIKYVCRFDAKNGLEDLEKAKEYLEILIRKAKGEDDYVR